MKTCKRCKKSLPNNMKICKYCGMDVSKIKPKATNKTIKTEFVEKKEEKFNASETKTEFLFTNDYKNYKEAKNDKEKKKNKVTEQLEVLFTDKEQEDTDVPDLLFSKKVKLQKKSKTKSLNIKKDKNNIKKNKEQAEKEKLKEEEIKNKITKAQQLEVAKKREKECKVFRLLVVFVSILCLGYAGFRLYQSIDNKGTVIRLDEKDRKIMFKMNEIITYKNISYSVTKVETSEGTAYRRPKEGNYFVVVTINMVNNSKEKYKFSHNDWKMTNSTGEEQERIISPINAGEALYSGFLVVGATKSGSLVFEQPIDDKKLEIRYYEPEIIKEEPIVEEEPITEDETEDEEVEPPKKEPIFSIAIKTN